MAQILIGKNDFSALVLDQLNNDQTLLNPAFGLTVIGGNSGYVKGGTIFTWRLSKTLNGDWTPIVDETTTTTPTYLDQLAIKGIAIHAQSSFAESDISKIITQTGILQAAFVQDLANYVADGQRQFLIPAIKGAFNAASASPFIKDISGIGSGKLTASALIKIKAEKYPNKQDGFVKTLVVHPLVYADLLLTYQSQFANTSQGADVSANGKLPPMFGYNIVVSQQLCTPEVTDGVTLYPSYLCADGAFMIDFTRQPMVETQRDILKGGGTTNIAINESFYCTFHAASWKGAEATPTVVALETGTNWEFKYHDAENVKAIKILSKLDELVEG